jgi:plastocyanin
MRFRKSAPRASSPCLRAPEAGRGAGWAWLGVILAVLVALPPLGAAAAIEGKVALPPAKSPPVVQRRYDMLSTPVPKTPDGRNDLGILIRLRVASPNPPVAVVYLEGDFPRPAKPPTVRMEQRDQAFVPALLPIQVGTNVEFPNLDQGLHSVFTKNSIKEFDLGRYRPNETPPPQLFDRTGLWTIRCDIHDNMVALILVLPTPYFVVTDREGRYRLPDLPPGRYTLSVWKDSATTLSVPVTVPADGVLKVDFP